MTKKDIKIKINPKNILIFEIVFILYVRLFIDVLSLGSLPWFFCDAANVLLFSLALQKISKTFKQIKANFFLIFFIVFFLTSLVGVFLNKVGFFLAFWGCRNIGRMFLFWINCIVFFKRQDLYTIFKILYTTYIINFFVSLFQYFFFGLSGDYLGGVFGITQGTNTFVLSLLIIIVSLSVSLYLQGELKIGKFIVLLGISIIIAPLAEIKAFFLLAILVFVFLTLSQKNLTLKQFANLILGCVAIIAAIKLLDIIFPASSDMLRFDNLYEYFFESEGYSREDDLGRGDALRKIYEKFFEGNITKSLFGFGLGSTEASTISIFNSRFYNTYKDLHYRWFFHATTFLELGIVGLVEYLVFFVGIFVYSSKLKKKVSGSDYSLAGFGQAIIICCAFLAFYDSGLRMENGYLLYLAMSVPFIIAKDPNQCKKYEINDKLKIFKFTY